MRSPPGRAASATPAPYVVPRRREAALRKLAAAEQRLHDTLGRARRTRAERRLRPPPRQHGRRGQPAAGGVVRMTPVQALQKALAAEHAAVILYGLLGAQSSKSRQPSLFARLSQAYEVHRDSRDQLTVLISDKGIDPVAAGVDYGVPGPHHHARADRGRGPHDRAPGDPYLRGARREHLGPRPRWAITPSTAAPCAAAAPRRSPPGPAPRGVDRADERLGPWREGAARPDGRGTSG